MTRRLLFLLPVLIFAVVAGYFLWGLAPERDPGNVPTAMIDKPTPTFDLIEETWGLRYLFESSPQSNQMSTNWTLERNEQETNHSPVVARGRDLTWVETPNDYRIAMLIGRQVGFPTQGTNLCKVVIPAGHHSGRHRRPPHGHGPAHRARPGPLGPQGRPARPRSDTWSPARRAGWRRGRP